MVMANNKGELTFWDHLDVLRGCLVRILLAAFSASVVAFTFKEQLFAVVLAPSHASFPLYRLIGAEAFQLHLMNTGLTEQFMIHMKVALTTGVLVTSPYILYLLLGFITPALYENERRYSLQLTLSAYSMFLVGVAVNYLIVFPLTVRFLGTYQVSSEVQNMLTLSSYIDTLLGMSLAMGLVFELPVLSWLLAKLGLLKAAWMSKVRRHAVVTILIIAAVVTPTSDMFTLLVVSLPIYLLYEISIGIVSITRKK